MVLLSKFLFLTVQTIILILISTCACQSGAKVKTSSAFSKKEFYYTNKSNNKQYNNRSKLFGHRSFYDEYYCGFRKNFRDCYSNCIGEVLSIHIHDHPLNDCCELMKNTCSQAVFCEFMKLCPVSTDCSQYDENQDNTDDGYFPDD